MTPAPSATPRQGAPTTSGWRLGPEHPDYAAETRGKDGLIMARRFHLTPEGEASVSRADSAWSELAASRAQRRRAPSGHSACHPSLRWLCDGELPFGWIKEASRGTE